jgi:hypothetical protein
MGERYTLRDFSPEGLFYLKNYQNGGAVKEEKDEE